MAKQPVAAAPDILDAVIVARQPLVVAAAPPFGGDALGPFVAAPRLKRPAPAEELRRAVGDHGGTLERRRRTGAPEGSKAPAAGRERGAGRHGRAAGGGSGGRGGG